MPAPQIPEELTRVYWQNHKGMIAKMAGYTGLSEAMDEVDKVYGRVDWSLFNERKADERGKNLGIEEFDAWFARAKAEYPKVVVLRQEVYQLRDRASETEERFRTSALIPASARRLAGDIKVAAEHFAVSLRSMGDVWEHQRQELVQLLQGWRRRIGELLHNVQQEAVFFAILPDPPAAKLQAAVYQNCRSLSINIRSQADLRPKLYDDWRRVAMENWYTVEDGEPVRQKARELQALCARSLIVLASG